MQQIYNISETTSSYMDSADSGTIVSLSEQMALAKAQSVDEGQSDAVSVIVSELSEWLMGSSFATDPQMPAELLRKIKGLKNEDGSAMYQSFSEISSLITLLEEKLKSGGYVKDGDTFFPEVIGLVFGLDMFTQSIIKDIFYPAEKEEQDTEWF